MGDILTGFGVVIGMALSICLFDVACSWFPPVGKAVGGFMDRSDG